MEMKSGLLKRVVHSRHFPVFCLLFMASAVAILLAPDYGISVDEEISRVHAKQIIEIFMRERGPLDTISTTRYYGRFYSVIIHYGVGLVRRLIPWFTGPDSHHFMYFLPFLLSVFLVYDLSLRFVGRTAAFIAAVLFLTQPMLFGHGFINPKDPAFMASFAASVAMGFRWVDAFREACSPSESLIVFRGQVSGILRGHVLSWKGKTRRTKNLFLGLVVVLALVSFDLFVLHSLQGLAEAVLGRAYRNEAAPVIQWLFNQAATDAFKTSLDAYIAKIDVIFLLARQMVTLIWSLPFLVLVLAVFPAPKVGWRTWLMLLFSGVILGLAISNRIFGAAAAGIIGIYALIRLRERSLVPLFFWLGMAAVTAYAVWPYLWPDPVGNFIGALEYMSSFPDWKGSLLFAGRAYKSPLRPWYFVPWLVLIQLTIPVFFLAVPAMMKILLKPMMALTKRIDQLLVALWFILPVLGSLLPSVHLYDNLRQLLFILPPLFILGSLSVESLLKRYPSGAARMGLFLAILLPGVGWIIRLHPFQYAYYNAIVGGVRGAFTNYELDYWYTSSRDAVEYVNQIAPPNAVIGTNAISNELHTYLREDLRLVQTRVTGSVLDVVPDYSIICLRGDHYRDFEIDLEKIYTVEIVDGVPLAFVFKY